MKIERDLIGEYVLPGMVVVSVGFSAVWTVWLIMTVLGAFK
jgi:hypothetical protein